MSRLLTSTRPLLSSSAALPEADGFSMGSPPHLVHTQHTFNSNSMETKCLAVRVVWPFKTAPLQATARLLSQTITLLRRQQGTLNSWQLNQFAYESECRQSGTKRDQLHTVFKWCHHHGHRFSPTADLTRLTSTVSHFYNWTWYLKILLAGKDCHTKYPVSVTHKSEQRPLFFFWFSCVTVIVKRP